MIILVMQEEEEGMIVTFGYGEEHKMDKQVSLGSKCMTMMMMMDGRPLRSLRQVS